MFARNYELLKDYTIELMDHWALKNKYNYQGQRRVKDLKDELLKHGRSKDLKREMSPANISNAISNANIAVELDDKKKSISILTTLALFLRTGKTDLAETQFFCIPYRSSGHSPTSLRGTLVNFITPRFKQVVLENTPIRNIQEEIIAETNGWEDRLVTRKIELTRFLNRYIAARQPLWSKMHGVTRAYELTAVFNNCKSHAELDRAEINFMHTGQVGSDYSSLNVFAPSGTDLSSLRGELANYFFMPEAERRDFLKGSPNLVPNKPKAVAPSDGASSTIVEVKKDNSARDNFLRDLPTLTPLQIAARLKKTDFNAAQYEEAVAHNSIWSCLQVLTNIFRLRTS